MSNNETLKTVFISILEIEANDITTDLKYQSIPQWDSINHMFLISEIENVFDIEINSEDILEIKSFEEAQKVLSKYGIDFQS